MYRHRVQLFLKFIMVLILALGFGMWFQKWLWPRFIQPSLPQWLSTREASTLASATVPTTAPHQPLTNTTPVISALPATVLEVPPTIPTAPTSTLPVSANIRGVVMVAGLRHKIGSGRIALPSGTRFQLQITSDLAGTMELHEHPPEAGNEPLWIGDVSANTPVESPVLRLAGKRGLETLYLVLRVHGQGIVGRQRVEIWHL